MLACRRMDFPERREAISFKTSGQPRQRGPEPTVHISHLAIDEAASEDFFRIPERARTNKDGVSFRMPPPTATNRLAGNGRSQARHWAAPGFEDDSEFLDEGQGLPWRHSDDLILGALLYRAQSARSRRKTAPSRACSTSRQA